MRIRKLSRRHIDTASRFLQEMAKEMATFGAHPIQDSDQVLGWFKDHIYTHIEIPNHLFLIAEENSGSGEPLGILEASISESYPIFFEKASLHIHSIFVIPDQRRTGVAHRLIEAALKWGQKRLCGS